VREEFIMTCIANAQQGFEIGNVIPIKTGKA
jgi:hypothetical protein